MPVDRLMIFLGVAAALVAVIALFVVGQFLNLYIQCLLSNAPIAMLDLIGMRLRKTDIRTVALSRIRCVTAGLDIPVRSLEVHFLAGGRLPDVVSAMIAARQAGVELMWDEACARDLAGRDVLGEVQRSARSR